MEATVAALKQYRGRLKFGTRRAMARFLELVRAPGIGEELYPVFLEETDPHLLVQDVRALAAARDSRALELALCALPRLRAGPNGALKVDRLEAIAGGLGAVPGGETLRFLESLQPDLAASRSDSLATSTELPTGERLFSSRSHRGSVLAEAMVRADRERGGELLGTILDGAPSPAPESTWLGLAGTAFLGDDRAADRLGRYLDRRRAGPLFAAAVHFLASLDRPAASSALLEAFLRTPAELPLVLAMGHRGITTAVPELVSLAAAQRPAPLRAAAAIALGLVGQHRASGVPVVPALGEMLRCSDPALRDAACWALGRRGDLEALDPLRAIALSDADELGRAAMALAELGDSESAPALASLLARLSPRDDPTSLHRRALVAICLGRLGHRGARDAIQALATLSGQPLAAFAGKAALRLLMEAPEDGVRVFWIDPLTPLERTGIRLRAGQSLDLRAAGFWGWGSPSAVASWDAVPARPGPAPRLLGQVGPRTFPLGPQWSRILAEEPGELVLLTLGAPQKAPPGADEALVPARAVGLVRVEVRL
ncbi:MAG: HEAT repeat domain-containing protein [Candidatus Riflebacteria bacterium]|nr:HEAT repeat domain-containing protein [Candidatus Riflebacteria bacterium]